jgi:hypothetical protein
MKFKFGEPERSHSARIDFLDQPWDGAPIAGIRRCGLTPGPQCADKQAMNDPQSQADLRQERILLETDRQRIVGLVTLPPEGYQSRFSDFLNRTDVAFLPLVDVEITSLESGEVEKQAFAAVGKPHIRFAYLLDETP